MQLQVPVRSRWQCVRTSWRLRVQLRLRMHAAPRARRTNLRIRRGGEGEFNVGRISRSTNSKVVHPPKTILGELKLRGAGICSVTRASAPMMHGLQQLSRLRQHVVSEGSAGHCHGACRRFPLDHLRKRGLDGSEAILGGWHCVGVVVFHGGERVDRARVNASKCAVLQNHRGSRVSSPRCRGVKHVVPILAEAHDGTWPAAHRSAKGDGVLARGQLLPDFDVEVAHMHSPIEQHAVV